MTERKVRFRKKGPLEHFIREFEETVVTRNTKDFPEVPVLNPFEN